ncbi:MAG: arylsulfatase [Verrucomicrobiae bacterium]|nr:arylsulfatase [Verrucomicrobiae bacterium]
MKLLRIFLCLLILGCSAISARAAEKTPNVILILADDMAVGDLSCFNEASRTPNLDRLKQESLWFSQAYSGSAVCAPARASLLTGRYPHRTGVVTLNMEKYPELTSLKLDETTLADRFRAASYRTGIIGKWHLGTGEAFHPLKRGFDEAEVFIGHLMAPRYFRFRLDINGTEEEFQEEGDYLTTELSSRAVDFVRRHRDEPFFLHLAHYAPHRPIDAPADRVKPYLDRGIPEETATVYAMIEIMDEGIGELLAELDALGIADNTLVIFASDNGPDPLVEERFNLDLRGTKYTVHEGGIRVPFMVRWPGKIEAGESDAPIHFADVLPTLIDLCDLPFPENRKALPLDGVSFRSVLEGGKFFAPAHRFWQWNRHVPLYSHNAAMRDGRWKLVRPFVTKNLPDGPSDLPPMLFDLEADPIEATDLATEQAERVKAMNAALDAWSQEVERDRLRK